MRVFGITSIPATRSSKAEFVLPVPMGSPQNYYGVGFYEGLTGGAGQTAGPTPADVQPDAAARSPSSRTGPNGYTSNNQYATGTVGQGTAGQTQAYGTFGLSVARDEHDQRHRGPRRGQGQRPGRLQAGGRAVQGQRHDLDRDEQDDRPDRQRPGRRRGRSSAARATCGAATWTAADFADGKFLVRLRAFDPESTDDATNSNAAACNNTATVSVDALNVTVYTTTARVKTPSRQRPAGGHAARRRRTSGARSSPPAALRENGDRYDPCTSATAPAAPRATRTRTTTRTASTTPSSSATARSNGQVQLFDPMFCATGDNGHGGSFGAGDHWTDHSAGARSRRPVAVTYRLYDMHGTPLDTSDDGAPLATLNYDPGTKTMGDFSGDFGTPPELDRRRTARTARPTRPTTTGSTLATGLAGGHVPAQRQHDRRRGQRQRRRREPVLDLGQLDRRHGPRLRRRPDGRLRQPGRRRRSKFYLAQIEAAHAGKTMVDPALRPGRVVSGDAFLRILSPDGNAYNYATLQLDLRRRPVRDGRHPDPDLGRRGGPVQQPPPHDHDPAAVDLRLGRAHARRARPSRAGGRSSTR